MSNEVIRVDNLGKQYRIGGKRERYDTLRDVMTEAVSAPFRRLVSVVGGGSSSDLRETTWALKNVFMEIQHGEVVGVIGRNGAGKSTLLKILSRITDPTEGQAEIRGRVGSLLEVGTGFHPELTGRENVYLNGAILGMTRVEIEKKFDEIVAFADVDKFIDTPVKHYSSGMQVRLAFSVAAHLEPEVLLVDEVLAVGDVEFQKKCLGKMGKVAQEGRTVLFVSHNMAAIQALCEKVVLLDRGRVQLIGMPAETIAKYLTASDSERGIDLAEATTDREGNGVLRFTRWSVVDAHFGEGYQVGSNHACEFRLYYEAKTPEELKNVSVSLTIKDSFEQPILTGATAFQGLIFPSVPSSGVFTCSFDAFPLLPNSYKVHLWCSVRDEVADRITDAGSFTVVANDVYGSGKLPRGEKHGFVVANHHWQCEREGQGQ